MKKVLLGTTALVAAGVLASGGVQAAEKVKLGVGGYFNSAFGVVSEDDDSGDAGNQRHSKALNQDNEIHFKGETTLENGISVGARVELEGFQSGDQVDERWVYFRGGFGELRYGDEDDARKLKSYAAPTPTPNTFGVNSPFFTFNNNSTGQGYAATTNSTFRNVDNDAAKLIYFTPSFGGLQLAASYAPDGAQDRTGFGTPPSNDCGQASDNWSIAADYSGEMAGLALGAGGGFTQGYGECSDDGDPWIAAGGVNVGFGGFTVGGSVLVAKDIVNGTLIDGGNETDWDVGVTYALDAITVGAGWSRGIYDRDGPEDTMDQAQIGASYALGPGISVDGFVGVFDYDADGGQGLNSNSGWQTGVGTAISF